MVVFLHGVSSARKSTERDATYIVERRDDVAGKQKPETCGSRERQEMVVVGERKGERENGDFRARAMSLCDASPRGS